MMDRDVRWLCEQFGLPDRDAAERFMGSDVRRVYPEYVGPELTVSPKTGATMTPWGITAKDGDYAVDGHPLAGADEAAIDAYPYPKLEWFDFEAFAARPPIAGEYMIRCGEPFSLLGKAYDLVGMEEVMIGFFETPGTIHRLMEHITECRYRFIARVLETAPWVDEIHLLDELGTQAGLLLSPAICREFVFPYHRRLAKLVHSHGRRVFYHTCGSVGELIEDLIDLGVDVLNNIQPSAPGNDIYEIKRRYGQHLLLCTQADEIDILPHWEPDAIYRHYRQMFEELAVDGGVAFEATFRSETTPPENLQALLRAVTEPL